MKILFQLFRIVRHVAALTLWSTSASCFGLSAGAEKDVNSEYLWRKKVNVGLLITLILKTRIALAIANCDCRKDVGFLSLNILFQNQIMMKNIHQIRNVQMRKQMMMMMIMIKSIGISWNYGKLVRRVRLKGDSINLFCLPL